MMPDPRCVAARRVLLNALEALQKHLEAIVVAGAQAVYLRTGDANIGVAEYTTDGDLVVDSSALASTPLLADVMSERFDHARGSSGAEEPGAWVQAIEIEGGGIDVPIDLIVPSRLAPPGGSRGARLGPHGNRAARKAVGLEAAVVDNDILAIRALDPDDERLIRCKVAGPTPLLIAKAQDPGPPRAASSARPANRQGRRRCLPAHADDAGPRREGRSSEVIGGRARRSREAMAWSCFASSLVPDEHQGWRWPCARFA